MTEVSDELEFSKAMKSDMIKWNNWLVRSGMNIKEKRKHLGEIDWQRGYSKNREKNTYIPKAEISRQIAVYNDILNVLDSEGDDKSRIDAYERVKKNEFKIQRYHRVARRMGVLTSIIYILHTGLSWKNYDRKQYFKSLGILVIGWICFASSYYLLHGYLLNWQKVLIHRGILVLMLSDSLSYFLSDMWDRWLSVFVFRKVKVYRLIFATVNIVFTFTYSLFNNTFAEYFIENMPSGENYLTVPKSFK